MAGHGPSPSPSLRAGDHHSQTLHLYHFARFDAKWSVAWARTESVVASSGGGMWSVTSTKKKSTEAHLARPGSPIERARRVARLERW